MSIRPDILCIGSVLWDVIGRTDLPMTLGNDKPGRITRLPGGVALNIAMTLRRFDMTASLISVVGRDAEGAALLAACGRMGLMTEHMLVDPAWPTDHYMAIEAGGVLIAAIAHAHGLEAAGARILAPLEDGRLGDARAPWPGLIALDGNLTEALLAEIGQNPAFARADLRVAPASPGKALRLRPLLAHPRATLYLNREEAGLLSGSAPRTAPEAAEALLAAGARRVLVTNGPEAAAEGGPSGVIAKAPPRVTARRITGAGDTFMAAHIAAEARGAAPQDALDQGLAAAARYVEG